jgi:hypothetical protein
MPFSSSTQPRASVSEIMFDIHANSSGIIFLLIKFMAGEVEGGVYLMPGKSTIGQRFAGRGTLERSRSFAEICSSDAITFFFLHLLY